MVPSMITFRKRPLLAWTTTVKLFWGALPPWLCQISAPTHLRFHIWPSPQVFSTILPLPKLLVTPIQLLPPLDLLVLQDFCLKFPFLLQLPSSYLARSFQTTAIWKLWLSTLRKHIQPAHDQQKWSSGTMGWKSAWCIIFQRYATAKHSMSFSK